MNTNLERASAEEKTPSGRDQPEGVKHYENRQKNIYGGIMVIVSSFAKFFG